MEMIANAGLTRRSGWRARCMGFVYWLVRVDPDILATCPKIDHYLVASRAILLLTVSALALFAWSGFFLLFLPAAVALPASLVVVTLITLLDQFLGSCRWVLRGVLAKPRAAWRAWCNPVAIIRLVIGVVLSQATALGIVMLIFSASIHRQEELDRHAVNDRLRTAGEMDKRQAWQTILGARDTEVKQASGEVAAINVQLDAARRLRDSAGQQVVDNQINADCQLNGGAGCRKGAGHEYRKAVTRQGKAADDLRRAESDLSALEARRVAAEHKRDDAVAAYRVREGEFLEAARTIDARIDGELAKPSNDPLMAYMALQRVFESDVGPAARDYYHLLLLLLLVMEMSYVLVSEYFAHASIYEVRLIARTKILAAEAAEQYRRSADVLYRSPAATPQPSFRVIPRFGDDGN
jgi:Domain of unknown function (DUF4407)